MSDKRPEAGGQGVDAGAASSPDLERRVLLFSAWGSLFFVLLGIVWGTLASSRMIVFDSVYSLIGVFTASLSVFAAQSMKRGDDRRFPFGRSQMEPVVIVVKSLVLLALCVNAIVMSLRALLSGGEEANAFSGMIYCFVGAAGCLVGWFCIYLMRGKAAQSGLVKAECMQWLMDGMYSLAIMLGFLAAVVMERLGLAHYARYVDPLMMAAAALYFIKNPVTSLVEGARDLLLMAPGGATYDLSRQALSAIAKERGFKDLALRIGKAGQVLMYDVSFLSHSRDDTRAMGEMDSIRQEVEDRLNAVVDSPKWLAIYFVSDSRWA